MTRRFRLQVDGRRLVARAAATAAVAAMVAVWPACRRQRPAEFPGAPVVLVSIDTLRSDRLPAYGYAGIDTPHLERFRRDAIRFASAWSPSPMTLPSHVTMLSGRLPPEHGVRNNVGFHFDGTAHPHLPGLLRARGYATGAAVSTYVLRGETGLAALFEAYDDSVEPRRGAGFADQQRPGGATVAGAVRWLEEHARGPFFYFLHIYEPHVPWDPPEPFRTRYGASYDGEVAAADAVVGQFFDHLRRLGVYDRALIVVTSDHGEGLGDHGEEQHSILLYREAIQVPLLVKLPGGHRAGETVTTPVQLSDLAPGILQALGLGTPAEMSGRSFLEPPQSRALYAETLYPRLHLGWSDLRSMVDGRWHLIEGPRPELYDLQADPGETRDLAARRPLELDRLRAALGRIPAGPTTPTGVDPAAAERLAALGYLGTVRERPSGAPLPDPRTMLPQLERMRRGFHLAAQRRFEEAVVVLGEVVREQPANVEAWIELGEALLEAGRPAEAASAFETGLAAAGLELEDVVIQLGYARLRQRELAAAAAAADRAQTRAPAQAHELRARVALADGRLDDALAEADRADSGRNPAAASCLVGVEVRVARRELAGALDRLGHCEARLGSQGGGALRNLQALRADVLARMGQIEPALRAYRAEARDFPGNLQAQANQAALLFAAGRRSEARAVLQAMVEANPGERSRRVAAATLAAVGETRRR